MLCISAPQLFALNLPVAAVVAVVVRRRTMMEWLFYFFRERKVARSEARVRNTASQLKTKQSHERPHSSELTHCARTYTQSLFIYVHSSFLIFFLIPLILFLHFLFLLSLCLFSFPVCITPLLSRIHGEPTTHCTGWVCSRWIQTRTALPPFWTPTARPSLETAAILSTTSAVFARM